MLKNLITGCLFLVCSAPFLQAQQDQDFLDYIEKNKKIAIREMERAGIPASIKLAQGILESNAGKSFLARRANNHFGIKCGDDWNGRKVYQKDDDYDDKGKLVESCFRVYESVEACYVAHSEFLRDPRKEFRYGFLFRLDPTDYRRWAYGLKQAGYATSATYPEKLIELIERYELYRFDKMSSIDTDVPSESIVSNILKTNDVRYALATSGETVAEIAARTDIAVRRILDYNEKLEGENQTLTEGTKIYLQPKRNAYRGREKYHVVESGETMFDISQTYGVRLAKLYKRNRMEESQQPAVSEQVKLRGCKVKSAPKLRDPNAPAAPEPDKLPVIIGGNQPAKPQTGGTTQPTDKVTDPLPEKEPDFLDPIEEPAKPPVSPTQPTTTVPPATNPTTTPPAATPPKEELPVIDNKTDFEEAPVVKPDPKPQQPTTTPPVDGIVHTVQKGDTLWNISQRYGVKVEDIQKLNNLTDNNIKIGMVLRIK